MNSRVFALNVVGVVAIYTAVLAILFTSRVLDTTSHPNFYNTLKDALPLLIAIPAAWLAYCFQRRQAYLKDVRELWTTIVAAVQDAIQYTHLAAPTQADFAVVMKGLSVAIEQMRAIFANIGATTEHGGLFPFEGLKTIRDSISQLGFGTSVNGAQGPQTRNEVLETYKRLRRHFLNELQRGMPTKADSPYLH